MDVKQVPLLSHDSSHGGNSISRLSPNAFRKRVSSGCMEVGSAKIGVAALIAISFFNVSGGPWGSEDIFSKGGPFLGSAGILLFTALFSLPQCLLTAELSCAFPHNGGYAIWVREGLGDFWGVQEVYWQWVSGVADAAVYPVLLCDSILQLVGRTSAGGVEVWLWRVLVTIVLSFPTIISFHAVPALLIALAIGTAAPVAVFIAWGAFLVHPRVLLQRVEGKPVNFGKLLNAIFWNLEGWDCISTMSALIQVPRARTITRGLFVSLTLTSLQYLLVLLIAAGISEETHPWQHWKDGALPTIVGGVLGPSMGVLLLAASAIGNAGQYLSEFMEDSCLIQGAAEIGIAPHVFARQMKSTGTPYMANILQLGIICLLVAFDFSDIIVFDNFFSGMAVALQFASFTSLRWRRPELLRPYRVPSAALVLFVPATVILFFMIYHCFLKSGHASTVTIIAFAVGVPYGSWVASGEKQSHNCGQRSALDELLQDDRTESSEDLTGASPHLPR